jgi:hypothetical protein
MTAPWALAAAEGQELHLAAVRAAVLRLAEVDP